MELSHATKLTGKSTAVNPSFDRKIPKIIIEGFFGCVACFLERNVNCDGCDGLCIIGRIDIFHAYVLAKNNEN